MQTYHGLSWRIDVQKAYNSLKKSTRFSIINTDHLPTETDLVLHLSSPLLPHSTLSNPTHPHLANFSASFTIKMQFSTKTIVAAVITLLTATATASPILGCPDGYAPGALGVSSGMNLFRLFLR